MVKFNSINVIVGLFLSLPFAIVTGPFLTDLIVVILALYFLFISIKERLWIYYRNYFTYIFVFFYLYILIRSFFSMNVYLSLEHSLFYFRYLFFVLCICYLINNNKFIVKYFMYSLLAIFVILIFDAYIQFFFTKNIFGWENSINERLSGLFRDKYILGQYLARLYPVLLGIIFLTNYKNRISLRLAIILLFFIDVLVFISGDRTAFLLMTMSTIMILVLANQYKLLRLAIFLFSLISILLILNLSDTVYDRIVDETIQETGINQDQSYIISSTHQDLYTTSFKMFLDNKIFGQGPKMFRLVCSDDKFKTDEGCSTHPHNIYLQIMSELGLIGLLPILAVFLYINYALLMQLFTVLSFNKKSAYLRDSELFFIIAIYITLWPLAPSLSFFSNHFSAIYYLPVAFLLVSKYKLGQNKINLS